MSDVQRPNQTQLDAIRKAYSDGDQGDPNVLWLCDIVEQDNALARQFADCNKWRMELEATSRLMAEQLAEYHADHNERMEHIQRLHKELTEAQQRIVLLENACDLLKGETRQWKDYAEQAEAKVK